MRVTVTRGKADPQAMKKALKQVELLLLEGNDQTFRKEGPGWQPLSIATLAKRRKGRAKGGASFGEKILQDTGTLKNSMTDMTGGAEGAYRFNNGVDRVEVGTRVHYGKYHQHGTSRMPARPFATIPSEYRSKIRKAVAKAFVESI